MRTAYDILGVPRSASEEIIQAAFHRAAKACHPDLNADDPAAEEKLRQVIDTYNILKCPKRRAPYDLALNLRDAFNALKDTDFIAENHRRALARRFANTAFIGLASGGVLALAVWLWVSPSLSHKQVAAPAASLAMEWEQVMARGDIIAIREFAERNPQAPESEIARSKLIALIDSAEDVRLLQALSIGATDAIAERAQQRLARLRQLTVAKEDSRGVSENGGHANDGSPSWDFVFYLLRGERRLRRGDFDLAISDFGQAIRLQPEDALGYHLRANAWSEKGEFSRALVDYDVAINFEPNNPALLRDRGILWRRRGDLDRALVDFDH
jgi:curved DNA-binding protein CbpA